jgi:DNA-directed RNA polymerase subunit omega
MFEDALHNKYSLVKGAARRARQLQSGAQPQIQSKSMKACRVAQDEIQQGKVSYVVNHEPKPAPAEAPAEHEEES